MMLSMLRSKCPAGPPWLAVDDAGGIERIADLHGRTGSRVNTRPNTVRTRIMQRHLANEFEGARGIGTGGWRGAGRSNAGDVDRHTGAAAPSSRVTRSPGDTLPPLSTATTGRDPSRPAEAVT